MGSTGDADHDRASLADFARHALRTSLAAVERTDVAVRVDSTIDAVHDARTALRRLRSTMRFVAPLLVTEFVEEAQGGLRELHRAYGWVRQRDVRGGHLEAAGAADPDALASLAARALPRRAALLNDVFVLRDSRDQRDLRRALADAAWSPPFSTSHDVTAAAAPFAGDTLRRSWRRTARRIDLAGPSPSDDDLHAIRLAAKRADDQARVARTVWQPARRLRPALKRMRSVLGDHQDACDTSAWLADLRRHLYLSPDEAYLVGVATGCAQQARAAARAAWPAARRDAAERAAALGW